MFGPLVAALLCPQNYNEMIWKHCPIKLPCAVLVSMDGDAAEIYGCMEVDDGKRSFKIIENPDGSRDVVLRVQILPPAEKAK